MEPSLRPARDADLAAIQAIYAHHVLTGLQLAAQPVVVAEVLVVGAGVAPDHEHPPPVRREHVPECRQDRPHVDALHFPPPVPPP